MLRSWNLKMELSKVSGLALYLQIAQRIIDGIQQGRLLPSAVMPGTRELAMTLGVNRKTVVLTYDELIAQGWLVTENRRGTFVSAKLPNFLTPVLKHSPALAELVAPPPAPRNQAVIFEDEPSLDGDIDFSEGMSDTRLVPFEIISRAFRHALLVATRANQSGYDNPKGIPELRNAIASMLNMERGLHVDIENTCVLRSSQMAVFVAARIITRPNDYVAFESLTSSAAIEAFKSCGANILHVGLDEQGLKVDELEKLCNTYPIRAVFVTPQHQFPTTVTLAAQRRKKLLRLAKLYDFVIVEDDHDHEFHFAEKPVFPLAAEDRAQRVIYLGSLSKVLAPGLRIGYLVASPAFVDRCATELRMIDRQGNKVLELAILELLHSGEIQRHILRMSKIYQERRNLLQDLIETELGQWVDFDVPQAGLAFWLRFRAPTDMLALNKRASSEQVSFSPGSFFSDKNQDIQALRLGFASLNGKELANGIQRLKRVLLAC